MAMYAYHPHYVDAIAFRMRANDSHVYLRDANYNVTAVVDSSGNVVERYDYTPYGEAIVLDDDFDVDADGISDIGNAILYTGRWVDPTTGLQLNRNRWYHQQLGRWVSRDPIGYRGSQWNLYELVESDPTNRVDSWGLFGDIVSGPSRQSEGASDNSDRAGKTDCEEDCPDNCPVCPDDCEDVEIELVCRSVDGAGGVFQHCYVRISESGKETGTIGAFPEGEPGDFGNIDYGPNGRSKGDGNLKN